MWKPQKDVLVSIVSESPFLVDCLVPLIGVSPACSGLEANTVHAGEGELASAKNNLSFVTKLTMPNLYSELFAWLSGRTTKSHEVIFSICAVVHLLTGDLLMPWAFAQLASAPTSVG